MALPASGQISFNDIRIELGIPTQSPFSLESASLGLYVALNSFGGPPTAGSPHAISEWYAYDHSATTCYDLGNFTVANTVPADPGVCDTATGNYDDGTLQLYSDCVNLGSPVGCFMWIDGPPSGCTTTDAYADGVRAFQDGSNYYILTTDGSISSTGGCNQ